MSGVVLYICFMRVVKVKVTLLIFCTGIGYDFVTNIPNQ